MIIGLGFRSIGKIQWDIWLLLLYNSDSCRFHIVIWWISCHLQLCSLQFIWQLLKTSWATFDQFVKRFETNANADLCTIFSLSWSISWIKRGNTIGLSDCSFGIIDLFLHVFPQIKSPFHTNLSDYIDCGLFGLHRSYLSCSVNDSASTSSGNLTLRRSLLYDSYELNQLDFPLLVK